VKPQRAAARLIIVCPEGASGSSDVGTVFPLWGQVVVVGRLSANDLPLAYRNVSRVHARFYLQELRYVVEDLDSRFGTLVNDQPIRQPTPLESGDEIRIGPVSLHYWNDADVSQ